MKKKSASYGRLFALIVVFAMVLPIVTPLAPVFAASPFGLLNEANQSVRPSSLGQANPDPRGRMEFMGRYLFKGQLHAHTSVSDGVLLPSNAFRNVIDRATPSLDFFTLSDHAEGFDVVLGEDFLERLEDSRSYDWIRSHYVADIFTNEDFIALIGHEVTWADGVSGHLNIFATPWRIAAYQGRRVDPRFKYGDIKYDLVTAYDRISQDPYAIAMFNHPQPTGFGVFDGWRHFNSDVARNIAILELNGSNVAQFMDALDAGWRISPVWSADEHDDGWGERDGRTGVFAPELTRAAIYQAMRDRATYSTLSRGMRMTFMAEANGQDFLLGSTLPAETTSVRLVATFDDPVEEIEYVEIRTNNREVIYRRYINGPAATIDYVVNAADGDYFFVYAMSPTLRDTMSAPVWIGPVTRGTNFAPDITITNYSAFSSQTLTMGQVVTIPSATAHDREHDEARPVTFQVFNSNGQVSTTGNTFTVTAYDDYFVRFRSSDREGNTRARLIRLQVNHDNMNPNTLFSQFAPVVNVGATPEEAGVNIVTDFALTDAVLEFTLASDTNWENATTVASVSEPFQLVNYVGAITSNSPPTRGQALKMLTSHAFNLTGLTPGAEYMYRFAVSETGARTTAVYNFRTPGNTGTETIYILGDVRVPDGSPDEDYQFFNDMLEALRDIDDSGAVVVQLGDFITRTWRYEHWYRMFNRNISELGLLLAPVSGDHEAYLCVNRGTRWDSGYDPTSTFSMMYNTPSNGSVAGHSNYSFVVGDMHIAVLNTSLPIPSQLQWLREEMRETQKTWRIVVGHYSYFGGLHSNDPGIGNLREEIADTFQQLGIHLYVGGHDRVYKRTTISNQVPINNPDHGTNFVVAGSAGSGFYDNVVHSWDRVVFDENIQTGIILTASSQYLTLRAYTIDGDEVDEFTVYAGGLLPGVLELTGADILGGYVVGAGVRSTPGAYPETVVLRVRKYDADRTVVQDYRSAQVELNFRGNDQFVQFATPMTFTPGNTLILQALGIDGQPISGLDYIVLRRGLPGEGTSANPYELRDWDDIALIDQDPTAYYALMNDLDLGGHLRSQLAVTTPFSGVFDGQGFIISNYASLQGGLFRLNTGIIRNVGMVDAHINSPQIGVGILADFNTGVGRIYQVFSTGFVSGAARVGGIAGVNERDARISDSYSLAEVRSSVDRNLGGIVGHGQQRSIIERTYAMGDVIAYAFNPTNRRHAGGIVGYLHPTNTVRHNVAMNAIVSASAAAGHPVVGFTISFGRAILYDNLAYRGMVHGNNSLARDPRWMGTTVTRDQLRNQATFENLGWDFDNVWQWDNLMMRPILRAVPETSVAPELPNLNLNTDGYFEIYAPEQIALIAQFPAENYILLNDLDMSGFVHDTPIGFRGRFDGDGHQIRNFTSTAIGGLFATNSGEIRDVGIPNATVATTALNSVGVGVLVNTNTGTISRVFTSGSVTGGARVGGIAGVHQGYGLIEDSYSLANVHATNERNNGGIVGHAAGFSVIDRTYATGSVTNSAPVVGNRIHHGGIAGYLFPENTVSNSFALNSQVLGHNAVHPVVGFVIGFGVATVENNFSYAGMIYGSPTVNPLRDPRWWGERKTLAQTRMQYTFEYGLGWDFDDVWQWDAQMMRPVLQNATEDSVAADRPTLPQNVNGYFEISQPAHLNQVSQFPDEDFILVNDLDLTGFALSAPINFRGSFDGDGHLLNNFVSTEIGALFDTNSGTIRDLGVPNAVIATTALNSVGVGGLVNTNTGTISRVFTSGTVTGGARVGGIAGVHQGNGLIEDSYSLSTIHATNERNNGGIVGHAAGYSVIARTYATGSVTNSAPTLGNRIHQGGIAGYLFPENTVRDSFALNRLVQGHNANQPVIGFVIAFGHATLENNFAYAGMIYGTPTVNVARDPRWWGTPKTLEQTRMQYTFEYGLGWDFDTVWKWDEDALRPVLRGATEITDLLTLAPNLPEDVNGYFVISQPSHLNEMAEFPDENFILENDLDLTGFTLAEPINFRGSFNGNGHLIINFTSSSGGLFATNSGEIRDVGIQNATVITALTSSGVGVLVNTNAGTISRVFTSGIVRGGERVGGIAGIHQGNGLIEDSYSLVNVYATNQRNNGGIIGHAENTSRVERTYATGDVIISTSVVNANRVHAGGIAGYLFGGNTVRDSFALNRRVQAHNVAHPVIGFVIGFAHANLYNNFAYEGMVAGNPTVNVQRDPRWDGIPKTLEQTRMQSTFENTPQNGGLGWDFDTVWQWDYSLMRPVLQGATEMFIPVPSLPRNLDGYYEISQPSHLNEMSEFPNENFVLTGDLDLTGFVLDAPINFAGSFDGGGHLLRNFTSTATGGLFATNSGTIRDVGIPNATVATTALNSVGVGVLVNTNTGTISRVFTSGSVTGGARVGGIAGVHQGAGVIEDSYSLANVHATNERNNGGIVGHAEGTSRIERTYAMGNVTTSATATGNTINAGGIAGQLAVGNTVANSFALNRFVFGTNVTHPVIGWVPGFALPNLTNNFAYEGMVYGQPTMNVQRDPRWWGESKTLAEARMQSTFQNGLGWDFDTVWQWDNVMMRPTLRSATEDTVAPGQPNLPRNADGYYQISQPEHLNQLAYFPYENFILMNDLDLTGFTLSAPINFSGSFNGNGHWIANFTSVTGGLFRTNIGVIRDVGMPYASVETTAITSVGVGALVDVNAGTISRVFTGGYVTGGERIGGIVGVLQSGGVIEDSYSTVNVYATNQRNNGGIVGHSWGGSSVVRTYATGDVVVSTSVAAANRVHVGGIAGYLFGTESVRYSFALNKLVLGNNVAHPVIGFVIGFESADLQYNFAYEGMDARNATANVQKDPRWSGIQKTLEQTRMQSTFENATQDGGLGWDFDTVWQWSDTLMRPILQVAAEYRQNNNDCQHCGADFGDCNCETISQAIANAQTLVNEAPSVIDLSPAQVPIGVQFIRPATLSALQSAITAAQNFLALYAATASAAESNAAENAILTAISAFGQGILTGEMPANIPTVVSITPTGTNVAVATNQLTVTFNTAIDLTAATGNITISGATTTSPSSISMAGGLADFGVTTTSPSSISVVAFDYGGAAISNPQWNAENTVVTFELSGLAFGTEYTVTVSGFYGVNGYAMEEPHIHRFTTEAQVLVSVSAATPVGGLSRRTISINQSLLPSGVNMEDVYVSIQTSVGATTNWIVLPATVAVLTPLMHSNAADVWVGLTVGLPIVAGGTAPWIDTANGN
ncbi:MAG: metallophosphoesterase [Defluviitaleaceae bacterium]|nr:metallophosphoesterase [Defluviitaleaceae bacterium]MCL2262968.1 metallophosphoesterase [Defluviitaleaceae bacterium]